MTKIVLPERHYGEWTLKSPEAKRLFLVGLAALAARNESGSTDRAACRELAEKFGGQYDFDYFLAMRSDPGTAVPSMNDQRLLAALEDAQKFNDRKILSALEREVTKRKLTAPMPGKRKFSFDD